MHPPQSPHRPGFIWGTGTSAFQTEGARSEGGRGDSIWDVFADRGHVPDSGLLGCDSYHRWEEDLDLLSALNVGGYRFSISWPRVIPDGDGAVNREGLRFYRRVAAGLRERGIEPAVALYHWDLPQALQDKGGWADRQRIDDFARYTAIVADEMGDLIGDWYTILEPWVISMLGHQEGIFAPGITDWDVALTAGHHLLVSHGTAVREIKKRMPEARVGIALDCRPATPATDRPADAAAAVTHFDGYRNRWFFDPVFGRGYPEDTLREFQERGRLPDGLDAFVQAGDLEIISTPIDFLGVNYYTTIEISADADEADEPAVPPGPDPPDGYTEMGWKIDPAGLESFLVRVHEAYSPSSIVISENGASFSDGPDADGRVRDQRRIDYLDEHIAAVGRARAARVPVDGYYLWSLLDNLEWTSGYSQRFGLVWVDHDTGERLPKDSFHWYSEVAESRPANSDTSP